MEMISKAFLFILQYLLQLDYCFSVQNVYSNLLIFQQDSTTTNFNLISLTRNDRSWNITSLPSPYRVGQNQTFNNCALSKQNYLLCTHTKDRTINRIYPRNDTIENATSMASVFKRGVSTSTKLVHDDVHNVVYWYDVYFNKLIMSSLDNEGVVPYTILKKAHIKDFVVASNEGTIFYIVQGHGFAIWRSSMQGENSTTIVFEGLIQPTALDVDETEERVYWYDLQKRTIEHCNFDGSRRNVIVAVTKPLNGIHHLGASTLIAYRESEIMAVDFSSENVKIDTLMENINIDSFLILTHDTENAERCSNIGCEHYCVTQGSTQKCICTNGYVLHSDGRRCLAPNEYVDQLVFTISDKMLCYSSLQVLAGVNELQTCIEDYKNVTFLSADIVRRVVYFSENIEERTSLFSFNIDTKKTEMVLGNLPTVNGLVHNTKRNILYALTDNSLIALNSSMTVMIRNDVHTASHLSFSNEKQLIFWYTRNKGIEMCIPNSGHVSSLVAALSVRSIVYNHINERLYWTNNDGLWSIAIDGSDFRVEKMLEMLTTIVTLYENIFYLRNEFENNAIKVYDWDNRKTHFAVGISENYTVDEIIVIDSDITKETEDACQYNSGGCDQICYTIDVASRKCSCRPGFRLLDYTSSCVKDIQEEDFLLVFDDGNRAVFQIGITSHYLTSILEDLKVLDFDLDAHAMKMYYVAENESYISILELQSGKISAIQMKDIFPRQIVYDDQRQMLVFSAINGTSTSLHVATIKDISNIKTLEQNLEISSIAISIKQGYVFTSTTGQSGRILKHDYVRMRRMDFNIPNLQLPIGLKIDEKEQEVYWIEKDAFTCFKSSMKSSPHVSTVYYNKEFIPKSIAVDEKFIYILGENGRYVQQLEKSLAGSTAKIPLSPELGLVKSLHVYKKDFCPSTAIDGTFEISQNCSFLSGDVCTFICGGIGNVSGIAECSVDNQWRPVGGDNSNVYSVCTEEVGRTTEDNFNNTTMKNARIEKEETNNAVIALGVLFAFAVIGLIFMVVLYIYRRKMAREEGVVVDQKMIDKGIFIDMHILCGIRFEKFHELCNNVI